MTAPAHPRTDEPIDGPVVEQAKGVLMLRYGISSYEALAALARWSRQVDRPLTELCHALVKGICQGRVTPDERALVRWLEQQLRNDLAAAPEPRGQAPDGARQQHGTRPAPAGGRRWRYGTAVHAARGVCLG
jgi:hypothetical protein